MPPPALALFVYHQSSGELIGADGKLLARGYSGQPPHTNVTEDEALHDRGPIPRGDWRVGRAVDSAQLGPVAVHLEPMPSTQTFGREGFYVHGDSVTAPGFASHGCIIVARAAREILAANQGATVRVV